MAPAAPSVARSLYILARPRLLPFVLCLPLVGFGWAHWDRALDLRGETALAWILCAWTMLHCGTLWLNAHLDRDCGDVLMGRPVAVPGVALPLGYASLAVAVVLAFAGNVGAGLACLACAVLAVLYSHPKSAWKGQPLLGPLVNYIGYGLLSPLAGWCVVGVLLDVRTILAWLLGSLAVLGCYFAAQSFQQEEDRQRGYRTLSATHGAKTALFATRICLAIAFGGGAILALVGWLPRTCLVVVPMGLWIDRWLVRWSLEPNGGSAGWARVFAFRFLLTLLIGMTAAYGDYFLALWSDDGPVAGLATAAGQPDDTARRMP